MIFVAVGMKERIFYTASRGGATRPAAREFVVEENMKLIKVAGDDDDMLLINADQIEHARYHPATDEHVSQVEIMFAGNPVRNLFEGHMAEAFCKLLSEQQSHG